MFERFTPGARRVVVGARDVARRLGAERLEPEHLLLALAAGDDGPAARALAEAAIDAPGIEQAIEQDLVAALELVGIPASVLAAAPIRPSAVAPAFGVPAKHVLEQALRHAVRLGGRRLGAEHVLLGLLDPPPVGVARVLARLDVQPRRLVALVRVEMASGRC